MEKINETVNGFWININDMLELFHEIIEEAFYQKLTTLNPLLIELGKNVIIQCKYNITPINISPPTSDLEWKYMFIKSFILNTYNHWGKIFDKDEDFFADHFVTLFMNNNNNNKSNTNNVKSDNSIVSSFFKENAQEFHRIFTPNINGVNIITDDDKTDLWLFIIRLIEQSIEFVYLNRYPNKEGKYTQRYLSNDIKDLHKWKHKYNNRKK
uniref:Uncharacterized protein n=1 Tax=Pithovirus LCPAC102 TaxID=2506587 RepID=A0A4D5XFQ1_9VIRU|nr:MAG: uncharacterized protein LCPAC102_01400 [Pithovirus LCPAC102]